jgi:hypothetical protein
MSQKLQAEGSSPCAAAWHAVSSSPARSSAVANQNIQVL